MRKIKFERKSRYDVSSEGELSMRYREVERQFDQVRKPADLDEFIYPVERVDSDYVSTLDELILPVMIDQ